MILENIQKNITVKPEAKITNLIVEEKSFSLETVFGGNENVSHIQGIPVSGAIPQENQTLVFDGTQWIPAFLNKIYSITLTAEDIQRGYTYLPPALGNIGEKNYIELIPEGAPVQEYGKDFTVMNSDNNQHLVLIWTKSKPITGILYPICPSEGMEDVLDAGDKLQIKYNKE